MPPPSRAEESAEEEQFLAAMRQLEVQPTSRRAVREEIEPLGGVAAPATSGPAVTEPQPGQRPRDLPVDMQQVDGPKVESREDEHFLAAMQDLGAVPDKDRRVMPVKVDSLRRLRPAKIRQLPIDDRLDLHGQRVKEALSAVTAFVGAAARQRLRAVLIITGKGLHSPTGDGVLKRAIEQWIVGRGRDWVLGYGQAPREIGGRGAFVLELRRRRSGSSANDS